MNWDLMMNVVMSMMFFAPLLLALGFFVFMGVLVAFEGAVAFASKLGASEQLAYAPAAPMGPIAAGLQEAVRDEVAEQNAPAAEAPRAANGRAGK
ncbi:MAG: hypothetical protein H6Q89_5695 [Myxococcaceae bacterium]|nr:hypothetical protein [Myxococcaceae bacterium]